MLLLTSPSDKIQVITGSAVPVDVQASWIDNASGTITPGRTNTAIVTAMTTDVVAAPGASTQRNVRQITARNKHATDSVTVTVRHTDGTTTVELIKTTLRAGELVQYVDESGFSVLTADGELKQASTSLHPGDESHDLGGSLSVYQGTTADTWQDLADGWLAEISGLNRSNVVVAFEVVARAADATPVTITLRLFDVTLGAAIAGSEVVIVNPGNVPTRGKSGAITLTATGINVYKAQIKRSVTTVQVAGRARVVIR